MPTSRRKSAWPANSTRKLTPCRTIPASWNGWRAKNWAGPDRTRRSFVLKRRCAKAGMGRVRSPRAKRFNSGPQNRHTDLPMDELEAALGEIPILDIHTHLVGGRLGAQGLHDILLYHMVVSDLYSAGCPTGGRLTQ